MPFLPARGRQRTDRSWVAGTGDQAGLRPNGPQRAPGIGETAAGRRARARFQSRVRPDIWQGGCPKSHPRRSKGAGRFAGSSGQVFGQALGLVTSHFTFSPGKRRVPAIPFGSSGATLPERRRQASRRYLCWRQVPSPVSGTRDGRNEVDDKPFRPAFPDAAKRRSGILTQLNALETSIYRWGPGSRPGLRGIKFGEI